MLQSFFDLEIWVVNESAHEGGSADREAADISVPCRDTSLIEAATRAAPD